MNAAKSMSAQCALFRRSNINVHALNYNYIIELSNIELKWNKQIKAYLDPEVFSKTNIF